jgi:hypothetical protein
MPKDQWEIDAKDRLVRFVYETRGVTYTTTGEDVVSNPATGKNFDFELTPEDTANPVIALEIFRLVGQETDLGQQRAWSVVVGLLTAEMEARGIRGYFIRTPRFNLPKFRRKQFATETANFLADLIARNPDRREFSERGYSVSKTGNDERVVFAHIGGIRQPHPFESASEALGELLPTKNEQLNVQGRERSLLIINTGIFSHGTDEVRHFFSTEDLTEFPNVDQVFFEVAPQDMQLVFDRRVFNCYRDQVPPEDPALSALFIPFVEHRLSVRDRDALSISHRLVERDGSLNGFSPSGKDSLISFGESLAEAEEWHEVLWIIDALKDDPDPHFPNDLHNRMVRGENNVFITSVRGRLCWLIQKVVVYNRVVSYSAMLDILEAYAFGQDFYIRSQACVPLVDMAVRRRSRLPDGSRFMPEEIAERIKRIAFGMLHDSGKYTALLEHVSNFFVWIKDLSTEEVLEVLERLEPCDGRNGAHNRCFVLLYAALFRGNEFGGLPPFNQDPFVDQLHQELLDGPSRFRTSLMWQMAGGADDDPMNFALIRPFLESFLSGAYSGSGYIHFQRICATHIRGHAAELCPLILIALRSLAEHIAVEAIQPVDHWDSAPHRFPELLDILPSQGEGPTCDAVAMILEYRSRITLLNNATLLWHLSHHRSARADELRAQVSFGTGQQAAFDGRRHEG